MRSKRVRLRFTLLGSHGGAQSLVGWKTKSTILQQLQATSRGPVWNGVLARFREPIVRFAQSRGLPKPEAEDVAQETLLAFLSSFREGRYDRSRGRLSGWLFGIALRNILNTQRRLAVRNARIRGRGDTSFWSAVPDARSNTASWMREWRRAVLEEHLEQVKSEVSHQTFQAFELVARAGRTPVEAAATLGVTVKTVYNAKHRVLKRIRQLREEAEELLSAEANHALL